MRIALAIAALMVGAAAPGAPTPIAPTGETRLVSRLDGVEVSADLLTHELPIERPGGGASPRRTNNCTYSRIPCVLLESLELKVGGQSVFVPRSAFGDLSDVGSAALRRIGAGQFALTLQGGDAAESYKVELVFDKARVRERILTDKEAGMVAEKTVYFDVSKAFN
ncbi:MAG: hypothetical protein ABSD80_03115 [Caulobacteraceae bacterium]|jgi:hypothetical protein